MLVIYDEHMGMPPLPMMGAQMRVILRQVGVFVFDLTRPFGGPHQTGHHEARQRKQPQHAKRRSHTERLPHPSGQRIGQKPARMAERELRGEHGRAIFGMGGPAQQAP